MEPCEGDPWPPERVNHAACCLGYSGDHINLLMIGGRGRNSRTLNDSWSYDVSLKKWKEVGVIDSVYVHHRYI